MYVLSRVDKKQKAFESNNSPDYLEIITPDQAVLILKSLILSNPSIKLEFDQIAKELIASLDIDDIAENIYSSLEDIEMDDIWHRAGNTSDGEYQDAYDIIVDDINDILDPFVRKIKSYIRQNLPIPANILCKGVLKGLHDFEKSSGSEILNEFPDGPDFVAQDEIIELWNKVNAIEDTPSLDNFISQELSDWEL